MGVNVLGLFLNVPFAYYLMWNGPFAGIEGAAVGTILSTACMLVVYISCFFRKSLREEFGTHRAFVWDSDLLRRLFRFGGPTGVEFFIILCSFSSFVHLFHSYGPSSALSVTIAFNWDILVFLPLWGLNVGLMAMVGKFQGRGDPMLSVRSTYSALKVALAVVGGFSTFFLFFSEALVLVFMSKDANVAEILALAVPMLRTVALYCFATACTLVFSAPLRAAGDTKACMVISLVNNGLMFSGAILSIKVLHVPPLYSWLAFVFFVVVESLIFVLRFHQNRWQGIDVLAAHGHEAHERVA